MLHKRRTILAALGCAGLAAPFLSSRITMSGGATAVAAPRILDPRMLDTYRDPADPATIRLPDGVFECEGLALASGTRLIGAGQGRTILRLAGGAGRPALVNADPATGDQRIEIRALTVDGNAAGQRGPVNGIQMERVTGCVFDVEVTDCAGSGFLLSGGGGNRFGRAMHCHGNGRRRAGYGLYIFGSSGNLVEGGRYDDNCIGIAVEASRPGVAARDNRLVEVRCVANRADFGQSGAGVHFEQSEGGDCDGGIVIAPICTGSTGVGINNTGCALRITGGYCADNREAGVVTIAASGFRYDGIVCMNNARGTSSGYRSEMRFDDSGLKPGSSGLVTNCRLTGTAPDGGMRTMSRHSAIRFVANRVSGYRFPYILSGTADRSDRTG